MGHLTLTDEQRDYNRMLDEKLDSLLERQSSALDNEDYGTANEIEETMELIYERKIIS
jgi:hypothetical protein